MTPIQQLRQEYKELVRIRSYSGSQLQYSAENYYKGMRVLCLNCSLVSFAEMEEEVNNLKN